MPAARSAPAVVAALEQLSVARPTFSASAVSAPFGTSPEPSLAFDRCRTPFGVKGNLWRKCVFRPGAFLGVVPKHVGSSGPPWRLRAAKPLSPKEDPDEASVTRRSAGAAGGRWPSGCT